MKVRGGIQAPISVEIRLLQTAVSTITISAFMNPFWLSRDSNLNSSLALQKFWLNARYKLFNKVDLILFRIDAVLYRPFFIIKLLH